MAAVPPPILRVDVAEVARVLGNLIALPSVNPLHDSTIDPPYGEELVAAYVEAFGRSLGLDCRRQNVLPGRDNVYVYLPGRDSGRTLLLECHMDTVPGWQGQPSPFEPRIHDGRMFGRGACDVKGALAAMLAAIDMVVKSQVTPRRGVWLAAVVDEEHQARGVSALALERPRVEAAIVGEPTDLAIVVAHKGCIRWRIATRGRSAHSSKSYLGINAVDAMVDLLAGVRLELTPLFSRRPHPLVGPPTLTVGTIHGGSAVNVVPDRCVIEIDRRTVPGEPTEQIIWEVENTFRSVATRLGISVEIAPPFVVDPALGTTPKSPIVGELSRAIDGTGGRASVVGVPFGTDASKLSQIGIPSVVFGPGSIDDAHTTRESVNLEDVARAADIFAGVITA